MTMTPGLRKLALTAHVVSSVGWLGAVAGSLALAVAGMTSPDAHLVRGAYVTLELTGWFVLVPLSLASLLTGLVMSLGTTWGLFRHYWVVVKFAINVFANIILLLYMQTLGHLADAAAAMTSVAGDLRGLRSPSPVVHAGAALLLLLVAATLSVYKPRGMTRYGRRKQHEQRTMSQSRATEGPGTQMVALPPPLDSSADERDQPGVGPGRGSTTSTPRWAYVLGIIVIVLILLFVILHLTGGGLRGHTS